MLCKVCLILMLVAGVFPLECVFEVLAGATNLNVKGVDKCESSEKFCAKIDMNGIKAKGCSKTARKITGNGMPYFHCSQAGCHHYNTICCCEGNKCNSVSGVSVMMSLLPLVIVKLFIM